MKRLLGMLIVACGLVAPTVQAEMIATDQALQPRERVKAVLERAEVAQRLQALGIAPADVQSRIDALSDTEVAALAARIDALPAGGVLSNQDLLIIVIVVLLVLLLL